VNPFPAEDSTHLYFNIGLDNFHYSDTIISVNNKKGLFTEMTEK